MSEIACIPLRARDGSIRAWAIVDAVDAEWLNEWRWSLCAGYASRKQSRTLGGPYQRTLLMHREILELDAGDPRQVDHINRDPLDNRRANLRAVTKAENMQNLVSRPGATSRYRGVFLEGKTGRWRASVQVGGRVYNLGSFEDEVEAARAAADFRAEHMPYSVEGAAV